MIENEYKWLLSKEAFYDLLDIISDIMKPDSEQTHINYYYDTDSQLFRKENTTVRIRCCNGELKGTIKKHSKTIQSSEETWTQSELPYYIRIGEKDLHLQGEMVTHRINFKLSNGIILSFDESTCFGKTDYELELEFNIEEYILARQWCDSFNTYLSNLDISEKTIINSSKCKSKSERFFSQKASFNNRILDYLDENQN